MKKKVIKIVLLSIPVFWGWISVSAVPPVVFQSRGAVQVSPSGTMRVEGGMHMKEGAVVTQNGLTILTGDFIHDASSNVFTTNYAGTVTGIVEFRGDTIQTVTTSQPVYTPQMGIPVAGEMNRKTMYLKFPDFKINLQNTGKDGKSRVVITPSMGVSVNKLVFTKGNLRLKSDENGGNDQDASLLVNKPVDSYTGGYMEIERNVIYNLGKVAGTTGFKYFGFGAPLANMYLDYFTDHWVFDQRMNGGAGGYDTKRYHRFDPGVGYFVVIREQSNTTVTNPTDSIRDGLLMQNKHFLFNRTFYSDFWDWGWNASVPASDNPVPQEVLNTGDVIIPSDALNAPGNCIYLGNPYTCALDVEALFNEWNGKILPNMWIWSGQASNWLTITNDMSTMDDAQKVVPSQQMFVVQGVSTVTSLTIPASARTHNAHRFLRSAGDSPHNELLIEVRDWELDNFTRMAIGLRSWGKLSGDDESDAKWLVNEDANVPQAYAVTPQGRLTINSLPEDVRSTDFDFVPAQIAGNRKYVMQISRQESLTTPMAVLVDKKENKEINLFENDTYEFFADKNDDTQRFTVRFAPENVNATDDASIRPREAYCQKQSLYITNNMESDIQKPVEIYNVSGQLVYRSEIVQAGTNTYELNLSAGVYIVRSGEMVKKINP